MRRSLRACVNGSVEESLANCSRTLSTLAGTVTTPPSGGYSWQYSVSTNVIFQKNKFTYDQSYKNLQDVVLCVPISSQCPIGRITICTLFLANRPGYYISNSLHQNNMIDTSVYTFRAKICTPRRANIPHTHDLNQTKNLSTNSPHIARLKAVLLITPISSQHHVAHCFSGSGISFLSLYDRGQIAVSFHFSRQTVRFRSNRSTLNDSHRMKKKHVYTKDDRNNDDLVHQAVKRSSNGLLVVFSRLEDMSSRTFLYYYFPSQN
ncbi:hypothetical protein CEXT_83091 [Caerostris extrusa]|uniref:Uncharacterized protein n=1 Tax=Caerostris extrusa TaxID=172846 RepID=A0AAV4SDK8_CAEEX|nr:hypothetical protein CEXT_83091 [Caerostris extrusa]